MNSEQVIKKDGFNVEWSNLTSEPIQSQDGYFEMRGWQTRAFDKLKNESYMILNAPMGSGKSWLMCLLSAFKLQYNNSLRCIISVPQTIIASGFGDAKLTMPDGKKVHWKIKHNLCSDEFSRRTINYFIKWLEQPLGTFADRTILCTHATLVGVYKKLKGENRLYLFNNILLWIDEAHHIKNIEVEGLDGAVINNGLGELVSYFLSNLLQNAQVGLATASFFRGDRATLLTDNMISKFKRFDLPYDEYFRTMEHLKSFNFDFVLSGYNYIKGIELIVRNRKGKYIIYIPHPVSQFSTGNKHQEVSDIIAIYGNELHTTEDGVTIISSNDRGEQKILDLVNETQRKQKKGYLNNPIIKKQSNALDTIIALGMFKEGANWIYADRSIIVGARSSLVDIIQMVGRLFRDAEGKNHVEVIQLLPFSLDQQDKERFRENLNNYLKAIYASLILENILNPVKIKAIQKAEKEKSEQENDTAKTNWLSLALSDDVKQEALMKDVSNHLIDILDRKKETLDNVPTLYDEYKKIIPKILDSYGITEYKEEVAKQIWGTLVRRNMCMQGLSVENIDFNIVQETHPLDFLLRYTSALSYINTFEKLRVAIQLSHIAWRSFEEARDFVRALGLKSEAGWQLYIAGKMLNLPILPNDIPKAPWVVYANSGWTSLGDFLGTDEIAPKLRKYRSYEAACEFAHSLNVTKKDDWFLYLKGAFPNLPCLPDDISARPDNTYRRADYGNKWKGWGAFLGTGRISNQNKRKGWRTYKDTHNFVKPLNLKTAQDWVKYRRGGFPHLPILPNDIPRKPDEVYQEEWINWSAFLGNKTISKFNSKRLFWSFEKAREFARTLGLRTQADWVNYCAGKFPNLPPKPSEVPSNPNKKYKKDWAGYKDWFGV